MRDVEHKLTLLTLAQVVTEFIAGYIWPGKPLANIVFKVRRSILALSSLPYRR